MSAPSKIIDSPSVTYYFDDNDRLHREDGPTVVSKINGFEEWRVHGVVQLDKITPEQIEIREDIVKRYSRMSTKEDGEV